jgi:hypothetical protein
MTWSFTPMNRAGEGPDERSISCASKSKRETARRTGVWRILWQRRNIAEQHSTSNIQHPMITSGAFAVTSGHGLKELVEKFKADHDDYNAIMAEALADRLAEAFAEFLHKRVREEWGYGKAEKLTTEDLIGEKYRGIRPAAGYPACPDHTEKGILWKLLDVEKNAGIKLTESFAMWPGSSVSGLYFAHPESKYFAVGKLGRDQLLDYHVRKGMTLQEAERWLGPYLNYEPAQPAKQPRPPAAAGKPIDPYRRTGLVFRGGGLNS